MKALVEYLQEIERLDEARRRVVMVPDSEKERRALQDLARQLDRVQVSIRSIDSGKDGTVFMVKDREKFDRLAESVFRKHGIDASKMLVEG